ncbi:class I SAM-dependent DNA methyltransferase [Adhaeribacter aerolatus]|uniref:site-specific DNA-methyltransferase (adenine-specific) n=1 Tax=Adhaeribacter aerolatus TaxID=670289 RepID=A0A512B0R0_9BACT|nr:BREX-1 system adenine-specific DNA-methyltransferase PglX [Adhaeribacter aerolatus]GEO05550.1 class I SAM-dependent DNA methyltransferase [Adhaeribacter aerolatus]
MDVNFDTTIDNTEVKPTTRSGINTSRLKTFAQKARTILLAGVERKVMYWGFDKKGTITEEPQAIAGGYMFRGNVFDDATLPNKWKALKAAINRKGIKEVVEEAAYTWFNRMMAIKILAQNNYDLPQLEYAEGTSLLPVILQRARRGQYDFLNKEERQRLQTIISDFEKETEAFGILLIGYCHSHTLLNRVFGGIDDYTELLLPNDILSEKGFLHLLNTTDAISEEDYKQVELIGWLYQFYISDRKDEVFAGFKKNKKAEAADIPAATQIFTPNWIVKYMVQNTVGKLWLDLNPESSLKQEMRYLVEAPEQQYSNPIIKEVADIKLLDPAVGSGHILVEGFDLLYQMYLEEYYPPEEAVESILNNNLFGLDIDKRAAQLSRFAILLKAASKNKGVLKSGILPRVYAMPEPAQFSRQEVLDFLGKEGVSYEESLTKALTLMQDAQNLGSIMQFSLKPKELEFILKRFDELEIKPFREFSEEAVLPKIRPFINVLEQLTIKYEAVAANPPYMGRSNMNGNLKAYIENKYIKSKLDLMTVFMEVCLALAKNNGAISIINIASWLTKDSFVDLRELLLTSTFIKSLLDFGRGIFGSDFGTVAFNVLKTSDNSEVGIYRKLYHHHVKVEAPSIKQARFFNQDFGFYTAKQKIFLDIPSAPFVYWMSTNVIEAYKKSVNLRTVAEPRKGITTGDDDKFIRSWWEVDSRKINLFGRPNMFNEGKWFPVVRGGDYRKWYGNLYAIMDWQDDGKEIRSFKDSKGKLRSRPQNISYNFADGLSWNDVSRSGFAARETGEGKLMQAVGPKIFNAFDQKALLGLLNSNVSKHIFSLIAPGQKFEVGTVGDFPIIQDLLNNGINEVKRTLINENVEISKKDWDTRETSWDFNISSLTSCDISLEESFKKWLNAITTDFFKVLKNEEQLNQYYINLYGLQEELNPEVPLSQITLFQDELYYDQLKKIELKFREGNRDRIELPIKRDVVLKQLISYAIGCFIGRYRLDKPGLQIAYPNPAPEEIASYAIASPLHIGTKELAFSIDEDAILPLMGKSCRFTDDVLHRTVHFIEIIWGEETLTINMNFLQECLNQDLEQYLVRDFWKDHVRTYKKKPIYWLFTSPKGAFQVLVYMHRMNRFTVGKIRDKYLLPHMQYLNQHIDQLEIQGAALGRTEARQLDKLRKDLLECEQYDLLLKDKADQQIEFDLDNGVTANYELFKGVVAPIK